MDKIREVRLRNPSPMLLPPDGGVAYVIVVVYQQQQQHQQHQQNNETLQISEREFFLRHTNHVFRIYRE